MTINIKIPIRTIDIEKQIASIKNWNIAKQDKTDIVKFLRDLELGKVTGNQVCERTLGDYISKLKIGLEYMNKPTTKLTPKDTEKLCEALLRNEIKWIFKKKDETGKTRKQSKPFVETSKIKIKNEVIKYLDWKLGDKSAKLTKLLKVKPRLKEPTPDFLSEQEIEKLFKSCKSTEERFLIAVLFDTGARAEEFHNIRKEDVELPSDKDNYVRITLKEEYSKTKGRTISLYWPYSFEAVRDYVNERIKEGVKADEPIFKRNYKSVRKFLYRLGMKALDKSIHYHLFRHSSATYYASKLNRQQLCYRYGWRFRSPMPDRYISRKGMEQKELDQKFEQTEISDMKKDIEKQKQLSIMKQDEFDKKVKDMAQKNKEVMLQFKKYMDQMKKLKITENY
jgi:integrase